MTDLELYEKIVDKIDEVQEGIYSVNARLSAIETDLKYHIRRTDALEASNTVLRDELTKVKGFFMYAGWILGGLATLAAVLERLGAFK